MEKVHGVLECVSHSEEWLGFSPRSLLMRWLHLRESHPLLLYPLFGFASPQCFCVLLALEERVQRRCWFGREVLIVDLVAAVTLSLSFQIRLTICWGYVLFVQVLKVRIMNVLLNVALSSGCILLLKLIIFV